MFCLPLVRIITNENNSVPTSCNSSQTALVSIRSSFPLVWSQPFKTSRSFCQALSAHTCHLVSTLAKDIMALAARQESKHCSPHWSCFLSCWYVFMSSWMLSSSVIKVESVSPVSLLEASRGSTVR